MAILKLFASAREAAGVSTVQIDALTVGSVLETAIDQYGPHLATVIANSKIWVNGDPAELSREVNKNDEIAILPPVSGGS